MQHDTHDKMHSRQLDYGLVTVIVLVGIFLRLVYLWQISHEPTFSNPIYDPEYNAYWARGLATSDWTVPPGVNDPEIRHTPHGRPPGYPWFLAGVYLVFGVNDYAPRLVQMTLGLLSALLMFYIGRKMFGRCVGFVAGLFMATYWVFPYFEGVLTYPALAVFVVLALFAALLLWRERLLVRWAVVAGALLGCFALLRPNGLLFAPVLLIWLAYVGRRRQMPWRRVVLSAAGVALACVLVLAPAFIRNYVVASDVVFISSYGGINLYVGNHPDASLVEPRIPELMALAGIEHWSCFDYPMIVRGLAERAGKDEMRFSEANRYFYGRAFEFIREQPGLFLKNMVRKGLLFWGPYEITNDTVMEYDKRFSPVLRLLPGFAWIAALFVLGSLILLWDMSRERRRITEEARHMSLLLGLFLGAYFLSVIIYFVAGRYRVPIIPVLLLFGAYGLVRLGEALRRRHWHVVALGLVGYALLCLAFHWNITGYTPSQGTWHLRTALAWTASGDEARAQEQYEKALKHDATSSVVYANLGRLHFMRGEVEAGLAMYETGLEQNPNNAIIRNNLGYELYQLGYLDAAREHLEHAVAVNPRLAVAHINLGNLLADMGEQDGALEHFEAALRLTPEDAAAPYNMARILFAEGDTKGAIAYYEQALALQPDFVEAWNNLGYAHTSRGELDDAIAAYRRAIAADPDYLLAYNNLGNALVETGAIDAARNIYESALARNPDDIFTRYNLGRAYMLQHKWEHAHIHFKHALSINPEYAPAIEALQQLETLSQ